MVLRKKITALLGAVACMSILGTAVSAKAEDQINQGIYIGDMNVSGMTYEDAENAVRSKVSEMLNSRIEVQVGENSVYATAVDLGIQWKNRGVVKEAMAIGNAGNAIKRYKDSKDLAQAEQKLRLEFYTNEGEVRQFVETQCSQFDQDPVEASIESDGGGGINLQVGEAGVKVNVEESVQAIENYVANEWTGGESASVSAVAEITNPAADEEDLASITDMLGTYTTYYGSTYGRNTNVERGAQLINGHLVAPGESFSVCDHLVPFSAENGYELGGEYQNGQVVQGYGGGICQVSTTLYNALLLAEIEIVERHNHTMSVSYVPPSMDAAIAEGSMDLVFRNNMDTPIFLSGYAYGGELTFTVWGKETRPADRYISYEGVTTSTLPAPTTTTLVPNPSQNMGYISQVQYASPGSTAVCNKYVTYNGETTTEQINSSTYEASSAIYEVGTIGATDALLTAIYSNDLAAAQLAATGQTTQTETDQTETNQSETTGNITIDPGNTTGGYVDTPDGEVWVDPNTGGYTDNTDGVVTWE